MHIHTDTANLNWTDLDGLAQPRPSPPATSTTTNTTRHILSTHIWPPHHIHHNHSTQRSQGTNILSILCLGCRTVRRKYYQFHSMPHSTPRPPTHPLPTLQPLNSQRGTSPLHAAFTTTTNTSIVDTTDTQRSTSPLHAAFTTTSPRPPTHPLPRLQPTNEAKEQISCLFCHLVPYRLAQRLSSPLSAAFTTATTNTSTTDTTTTQRSTTPLHAAFTTTTNTSTIDTTEGIHTVAPQGSLERSRETFLWIHIVTNQTNSQTNTQATHKNKQTNKQTTNQLSY